MAGLELRVNMKALLILAAIAVPVLLADMFFVLDRSRTTLDSTVGGQLQAVAEVTASEVSRFIHWKVSEVALLAADTDVRQAAEAANQTYRGLSPEALKQKFAGLERDWQTPGGSAAVAQLLAKPVSADLRMGSMIAPSFKNLILTDAQGAVIASAQKPGNYYYGDKDWWTATFRDGAGGVHVGDGQYDPLTHANFLSVSLPVLNKERDRAIGVLRAIIDFQELNPITSQIRLGANGEAMLVTRDGAILSSRNPALIMKQKAEQMEIIAPIAAQQASGFTTGSLKGGSRQLIAFANPGLSQSFPEADWAVIVSQDLQDVRAPITLITSRALTTAFGGLLLVALLAAYFSLHRPQKLDDIEEGAIEEPSR